MDSDSKITEYSNEIPDEIKLLLKGLSSDDRLGLIIALMKNGKMTFNEMKEKFHLHSSSLTNHLTALQDGNLVENFYEKGTEKGFSFYDVTDIPESVFDALFDIMYKPTIEREETPTETTVEDISETSKETGSSPSYKPENEEWTSSIRIAKKISQKQRTVSVQYGSEHDDWAGT